MARNNHMQRVYVMTPAWVFLRGYLIAVLIAALIGLLIGIGWVIAGLLHFHPLW